MSKAEAKALIKIGEMRRSCKYCGTIYRSDEAGSDTCRNCGGPRTKITKGLVRRFMEKSGVEEEEISNRPGLVFRWW